MVEAKKTLSQTAKNNIVTNPIFDAIDTGKNVNEPEPVPKVAKPVVNINPVEEFFEP